jgi:hypothetical protein
LVYAFDTLGYSKRLRESGVSQPDAEAHAEAVRDFVMAELVTKTDLLAQSAHFDSKIEKLEMKLTALETKLDTKLQMFEMRLDSLSLSLTVRFGAMLVVAVGILATILKLVP